MKVEAYNVRNEKFAAHINPRHVVWAVDDTKMVYVLTHDRPLSLTKNSYEKVIRWLDSHD